MVTSTRMAGSLGATSLYASSSSNNHRATVRDSFASHGKATAMTGAITHADTTPGTTPPAVPRLGQTLNETARSRHRAAWKSGVEKERGERNSLSFGFFALVASATKRALGTAVITVQHTNCAWERRQAADNDGGASAAWTSAFGAAFTSSCPISTSC